MQDSWVVVGIDNGGTKNNATVADPAGNFLLDRLIESPSRVTEGPEIAVAAMAETFEQALAETHVARDRVKAVGLDTPGPSSANGVISSKGSTNFSHPGWRSFDVRAALEKRLHLPVVYNNDANAAALYAHARFFGAASSKKSSVSAVVGTGLGGGVIEGGRIVKGTAGMAGELGHVHIPMDGLLEAGQAVPKCNCGFSGDAESVASLTGIEMNLLPFWLGRHPEHDLAKEPIGRAAKLVRSYAEKGDALALAIFDQQAKGLGRLFTISANFTDPDAYFVGGGVVEAAPHFREWFLARVRQYTLLRDEQAVTAQFAVVPDLDMAGARGSAIAAIGWVDQL